MSYGWIYLRKNVNLKGEVMAYCIGKTSNEKKRRKTYRKENPFIEHVEDYEAYDMYTAETMLRDFIEDNDMQLVGRSKEWLRKECFEEFYQQWQDVKGHYWVDRPKKPKPPKRKPLQPLGADAVKPLPPAGKPRPLDNRQESANVPPPVPLTNTTAQNPAPVRKQKPAFWEAMGKAMVIVGGSWLGIMALAAVAATPGIISGTVLTVVIFVGFLWVVANLQES